jgi:hypothetical protein
MKAHRILILIFIVLVGCNEKAKEEHSEEVKKPQYSLNQIVNVSIDSVQSYELFLPEIYASKKDLPVIIFFDPHANGDLPLELYKDLANQFQFILIGSNNSKNGLQSLEYNNIIEGLLTSISNKLYYDSTRITLCGFSGGGRVAGAYAQQNRNISSVISCSASIFGNQEKAGNLPFIYIGFVGYEDFNFIEMTNEFERINSNLLIPYTGEHNWPESEIMKESFMILNLHRKKLNNIDTHISELINYFDSELTKTNENIYDKFLLLKRANQVLSPYLPLNKYHEELAVVSDHPKLAEYLTYVINLKGVELEKRHAFALAFQEKEMDWWKKEIKSLNGFIEVSKFGEDKLMYIRLKNYLGMIGYFFTDRSLKMRNLELMWSYLQKYELVDNDNPDVYYYKAIYFVLKKDNQKAITALKKSIDLGFKDLEKLRNDEYLKNIYSSSEIVELIDLMNTQ